MTPAGAPTPLRGPAILAAGLVALWSLAPAGSASEARAAGTAGTVAAGGLLTVGRVKVAGASVSVPLSCTGSAGSQCEARIALSAIEILRRGRVIAVTAVKTERRTVVLAAESVTLSAGERRDARLSLNAAGRRLLARFRQLHVKLTVTAVGMTTIGQS